MMDTAKQDVSTDNAQFQPLNNIFHAIVLPPTNFESVYDQRDNDEVLSDIRQVKCELENSVLQSSLTTGEAFERTTQNGMVTVLDSDANSQVKASPDISTAQILAHSSVVVDEVQPVVENAVDCVVRNENEGSLAGPVAIEEDRQPGEADTEILSDDKRHLLDEFCEKHLSQDKRMALLLGEPSKTVITTPKLDFKIEEAIRQASKASSEVQRQAASIILATDEALKNLQLSFRKLSTPVLDLVLMGQCVKGSAFEDKIGDILCQLVLLNEQVVSIRRNRVLEHLKQGSHLAENLEMPKDEEDLFGSHFIGANVLLELKKTKRRSLETTRRTTKSKRARKEVKLDRSEEPKECVSAMDSNSEAKDQEYEVGQDMPQNSADDDAGELWNTDMEKQSRSKRTSKRIKPAVGVKKDCAKERAERLKQLRREQRDREKAEREAEKARMLAEINSGRKTRQSSKVLAPEVCAVPSEVAGEEEENVDDNDRDTDYRAEGEEEEEEDEEEVALAGIKQTTNRYPFPATRRADGNKEPDNHCEHCDYIADKRRKLIHHVKTYHSDKLIPCDLCEKSFAFQVSLWNHKNAMHLGAEFKCPQCTRSFKDAEKLRTHMFVHSSLKPFVCEICGKGCLTKVHLDSHIKVHERQNNLYCQSCDRYFGSNHTFRNHIKLHAGQKEWFCDICNAGFPIKPRLVLHKKIAHSDEQYICEECGKGFKMKHILNDHKALLHSSKKSFVCEICGVGFKLRSVLKRHMKTHSDERPHKCDLCDKAFKVKSTLVEHRKTHTNEKPYLCDQCGMAFKRNAERRKHNCVNKPDELLRDQVAVAEIPDAAVEQQQQQQQQLEQPQQIQSQQQLQMPSLSSHLHLQSPPPMAVHAQPLAVTTGHIVTHMPMQIAPQMIQLMPHSATLVTAGPQLMQVHDEQLQAVATAQFTNFSVG